MEMIKIDKKIKIPKELLSKTKRKRGIKKGTKVQKYPFLFMKKGQSFLFPRNKSYMDVSGIIRYTNINRKPLKFVFKRYPNERYRCWRIK